MKNYIYKISLWAFAFWFLLNLTAGNLANAQSLEKQITANLNVVGEVGYVTQKPANLQTVAGNILNVALGLMGIIFTIYLIYGGYLWIIAAGNKEEIDKAKKIITNSIIAVIIIFAAFAISNFVFTSLGSAIFGSTSG